MDPEPMGRPSFGEELGVWAGHPFPSRLANLALHAGMVVFLVGLTFLVPLLVPGHPGYAGAGIPIGILMGLVGLEASFLLAYGAHTASARADPLALSTENVKHVAERTRSLWSHHESTRRSWLTVVVASHAVGIGLLLWLWERLASVDLWFAALAGIAALLALVTWTANASMVGTLGALHTSVEMLREARPPDGQSIHTDPLRDHYRILPRRPSNTSTSLLTSVLMLPAVVWSFTALFFLLVLVARANG